MSAFQCGCEQRMNDHLAKHNGKLAVATQCTQSMDLIARLCVQTEKLDKSKRKAVPVVMASFCPFCGGAA